MSCFSLCQHLSAAVPMVLLALEQLKTRANGKEYTQAINSLLSKNECLLPILKEMADVISYYFGNTRCTESKPSGVFVSFDTL